MKNCGTKPPKNSLRRILLKLADSYILEFYSQKISNINLTQKTAEQGGVEREPLGKQRGQNVTKTN